MFVVNLKRVNLLVRARRGHEGRSKSWISPKLYHRTCFYSNAYFIGKFCSLEQIKNKSRILTMNRIIL